jgi:predicted dienelactone hydrolase
MVRGVMQLLGWMAAGWLVASGAVAQGPSAPSAPAAAPYVGLREVVLPDNLEPAGIRTWLWYPTRVPPQPWMANAYLVSTRNDAVPVPGRRPLVVLSHGSFGYVFGLHHIAEYLVRHGHVVATPAHPRDNNSDSSGTYTDMQLVGRSRHIARTIDGVLRDPVVGPLVDESKIAMVGFSAGGFTALTVLGAVPDFARLEEYCQGQRDDGVNCTGGFKGKVRILRPDWRQTPDPRVKAAVLLAPGSGFMFPRATLRAITRPVLIYRAAQDSAIRHPFSEEWIAENLGRKPEYHVVPGEHLVFLAPCPPGRNDEICRDKPPLNRRDVHATINAGMVDFFQRTLK